MTATKEQWKTYKDVFDERTLRAIFKLSSQGYFDELKSPISIGKESNVFSAVRKDGKQVVVKIYRVNVADFNRMYSYIYLDPRFAGLKKQRTKIIYTWAQREYANLLKAKEQGVKVPSVHAVFENVLVMEFIGDKEPAKQLKNDIPDNVMKFADLLIKDMIKLYQKGKMVHSDLSEYNILNLNGKPVMIDLSHSVPLDYPGVNDLLKRDIFNVCKFFRKCGLNLNEQKLLEMFK